MLVAGQFFGHEEMGGWDSERTSTGAPRRSSTAVALSNVVLEEISAETYLRNPIAEDLRRTLRRRYEEAQRAQREEQAEKAQHAQQCAQAARCETPPAVRVLKKQHSTDTKRSAYGNSNSLHDKKALFNSLIA